MALCSACGGAMLTERPHRHWCGDIAVHARHGDCLGVDPPEPQMNYSDDPGEVHQTVCVVCGFGWHPATPADETPRWGATE